MNDTHGTHASRVLRQEITSYARHQVKSAWTRPTTIGYTTTTPADLIYHRSTRHRLESSPLLSCDFVWRRANKNGPLGRLPEAMSVYLKCNCAITISLSYHKPPSSNFLSSSSPSRCLRFLTQTLLLSPSMMI